jgi:anti-sigma B factor antagonist
MSVKLTTRHRDGVAIVETSGKVTLGEGTSTLRRNIRELVDTGTRQIILNMADVTYMDSSGVGELLASHTTVAAAGGELKLLNVSPRVHEILAITRMDTIFEIFDDEQLAVDSFSLDKGIVEEGSRGKRARERMIWALQIITAGAFFAAAFGKFNGSPAMVDLFQKVGFGQWFRYLAATVETIGGILLLIPGFAASGALLLVVLMLGAVVTQVARIGDNPAHAGGHLFLAALVLWLRREQISRRETPED